MRKNIIPLIIEGAFIVSYFIFPKEYFIYTNFIFYLLLLIYFCIKKDFSLKEWLGSIKSGKRFWKQVIITALFFIIAFIITVIIENLFPNYNTGMIGLRRNSWLTLTIFTISTIILPAITEETFYRKNIISVVRKDCSFWAIHRNMFFILEQTVNNGASRTDGHRNFVGENADKVIENGLYSKAVSIERRF